MGFISFTFTKNKHNPQIVFLTKNISLLPQNNLGLILVNIIYLGEPTLCYQKIISGIAGKYAFNSSNLSHR
jgi:hypothetical protein